MPDAFQVSYAFTRAREGGVCDDPHDPGGLTNCGIIMADLQRFSRQATEIDLLALTEPEIEALYLALYWLPLAGWQLPPSLALPVFDHGFNCGIGDSAKLLQRLLGVAVDGQIGRDTLRAVAAIGAGMPTLLVQLNHAQDADYREKGNARFFLAGWEARLALRTHAALALSSEMPA